jgi:hypothetical protein
MPEAVPLASAPAACSAGNDVELGEEACSVCLAVMCGEEKVLHLCCGHTFHCSCISSWLLHQQASAKETSCPVCRGAAHPRECCDNAWTELDLKSQPRANNEPTSEQLLRRASARNRSGVRLYLLVLMACVAIVMLLGGESSQQMDGSSSSSEDVHDTGWPHRVRTVYGGRTEHNTDAAGVEEWQLMGNSYG